jgi:tetratricopeptide (TPR) repeat protein
VSTSRGEVHKALADYNAAIHLDPRFADAYVGRGSIWYEKGEFDKAIADYTRGLRLDPKIAHAFYFRALVWEDKREYGKALDDYTEAIRLDPEYAVAFISQAWLWATCPDAKYRDGKRAVASARRGCELQGWKVAYGLETLAAAYAEMGDFAQAIKWQKKVLAIPGLDKTRMDTYRQRLKLYEDRKPYRGK